MKSFQSLVEKIKESSGILESLKYRGESVTITRNLEILVNEDYIGNAKTLSEAKQYVYKYIDLSSQAEVENYIPEHIIVNTISKHHNVTKVTDTLIESYNQLISSSEYTIDPVVNELKKQNSLGKYEFCLKDGNKVSISEETQRKLTSLLKDKYDIVEYMKESVDNFKRIVREIRD